MFPFYCISFFTHLLIVLLFFFASIILPKPPEELSQVGEKKRNSLKAIYIEPKNKKLNPFARAKNFSKDLPPQKNNSPNISLSDLSGSNVLSDQSHLKKDDVESTHKIEKNKKINKFNSLPMPVISEEKNLQWQQLSKHQFTGDLTDIALVVPEGVKESQLNALEQMLYAFKKRIAETYFNNLISTYAQYEQKFPQNSFPWSDQNQILRAKLTYDKKGELLRVDFLKKSEQKILDQFYKDTLYSMTKIPNPPTIMLDQQEEFNIVYGLNINFR